MKRNKGKTKYITPQYGPTAKVPIPSKTNSNTMKMRKNRSGNPNRALTKPFPAGALATSAKTPIPRKVARIKVQMGIINYQKGSAASRCTAAR